MVVLSEYGSFDNEHKPFVYCTDDYTIGYLDSHYKDLKDKFIYFKAGKQDGINKYIDKGEILKLADACGLEYAKTEVVDRGEIPENLCYPIITKSISPNVGGWKSDVFICENELELKTAYDKIQVPQVLLQRYIEKKNELEFYGMSINHGEKVVFTTANNYLYLIKGYYSPYMYTFEPPYPEIQEKIAEIIKRIGFEGIFQLSFW